MPTVEFSPNQVGAMAIRPPDSGSGVFGTTGTGSTPVTATFGALQVAKIILFSGVMPAQPRLMTASVMANSLIFWITYSECTTYAANSTNNGIQVTTIFKSAYATGTATWFAWCTYNATPPATGGTLVQRIIGTVGTIGSGSDLEIPSTSIVTGAQYRVSNLQIALPSTYTY